jgi:hypothetical protein
MAFIWPTCSTIFGGGRNSGSCAWCAWWYCLAPCCEKQKRKKTDDLTRFLGSVATYRASSARISAIGSTTSWVASALLTLIHMTPSWVFFTLDPKPLCFSNSNNTQIVPCSAADSSIARSPALYRYSDLEYCGYQGVQGFSLGLWDACLWQPGEFYLSNIRRNSDPDNLFGTVSCRPIGSSSGGGDSYGFKMFAQLCSEGPPALPPLDEVLVGFRALAIIAVLFNMMAIASISSASTIPGLPSSRGEIAQFTKAPLGWRLFYRHEQARASKIEALSSLVTSLLSALCCIGLVLMVLPQTAWLPEGSPLIGSWRLPLLSWLPDTATNADPFAPRWRFSPGVAVRMTGLAALLQLVTVFVAALAAIINKAWEDAITKYVKTHQRKKTAEEAAAAKAEAEAAAAEAEAAAAAAATGGGPGAAPTAAAPRVRNNANRKTFGPTALGGGSDDRDDRNGRQGRISAAPVGTGADATVLGGAAMAPMGFGVGRLMRGKGAGNASLLSDFGNVDSSVAAVDDDGILSGGARRAFEAVPIAGPSSNDFAASGTGNMKHPAAVSSTSGSTNSAASVEAAPFAVNNPLRMATAAHATAASASASAGTGTVAAAASAASTGLGSPPLPVIVPVPVITFTMPGSSSSASEQESQSIPSAHPALHSTQRQSDRFGLNSEFGGALDVTNPEFAAAPAASSTGAAAAVTHQLLPKQLSWASHAAATASASSASAPSASASAQGLPPRPKKRGLGMGDMLHLRRSMRSGLVVSLDPPAPPAPPDTAAQPAQPAQAATTSAASSGNESGTSSGGGLQPSFSVASLPAFGGYNFGSTMSLGGASTSGFQSGPPSNARLVDAKGEPVVDLDSSRRTIVHGMVPNGSFSVNIDDILSGGSNRSVLPARIGRVSEDQRPPARV